MLYPARWALILLLSLAILLARSQADTIVQLHVNRPYNDVSENFVSFAVQPEDLYDALDGPNRKAVTSMAAMLGDAYIKFTGEYHFATTAPTKLRNPTKIIWKGFNRWTRAVNWTMIIPVPYAPDEWDSMHTLKILNSSFAVGITDCVWQLGTDFGTARAKPYVQELNTLKLMTDTFKPYVDNWRVMGADISAGSSVEETRRYVDMSKDVNAAFGWTQPPNLLPASSLGSYIFDSDPALKLLQQQRLPLWLTLPQEQTSTAQSFNKRAIGDDTTHALRWAQTLGDAASSGFDVVFKRMTLADFEQPNFSFYVTALFKQVMGSRVFPARPLNMFAPSNKLYTHCANAVSGGLSFMVVNTEDEPTTITVRNMSRLSSSDIWEYVLTGADEQVLLNNVKLTLHSKLRPLVKQKDANKKLQLITPSMSVGFWVLPHVNLEHCQYSEVDAEEVSADGSAEARAKSGYSSADRLLQKLIERTSVAKAANGINRQRRFVLDNEQAEQPTLMGQLLKQFQRLSPEAAPALLQKRELGETALQAVRPREALAWLQQILEQTCELTDPEHALLQRNRRDIGDHLYPSQGKLSSLTKQITEIRQPEQQVKPLFEEDEFDEEEFFKKMGAKTEPPSYARLPDGDVHLKYIEARDSAQQEPERVELMSNTAYKATKPMHSEEQLKIVQRSQEHEHDLLDTLQQPSIEQTQRKPRLLPSQFFETFPVPAPKPLKRLNLGNTLNSLLFPDGFAKNSHVSKSASNEEVVAETTAKSKMVQSKANDKNQLKTGELAYDFLQAQRELRKHYLSHVTDLDEEQTETDITPKPAQDKPHSTQTAESSTKPPSDESITSWWDLPALRRRRALPMSYSSEALHSNAIDRDEELRPLGNVILSDYSNYEYKAQLPTVVPETELLTEQQPARESKIMHIPKQRRNAQVSLPEKIVTTVKSKVSKFMNIISRHMNEWYNTLTRHLDSSTASHGPVPEFANSAQPNAIPK